MEVIIEIIKFTIPALVVFFTSFILLNAYLKNDIKKRELASKEANQKTLLPLRLQAYERLALFLERISPNNLIHRVRKQDISARDFHLALLNSIRVEFEHNLSQQIYISSETWEFIKGVKEEMIRIVNQASMKLPKNASGSDLSKSIFEILITSEKMVPTQAALNVLKNEVSKLY
ncbi:MAG: hypothetical protein IIA45_14070 [Bacteroidetes bacterium]|nr:hypothetical protein [Bacteroidota bacterium]